MKKNLFHLLFLLLILTACSNHDTRAGELDVENLASYQIDFKMNETGQFYTKAYIEITNLSNNQWEELKFYVIPNTFTNEQKPLTFNSENTFNILQVKLNNKETHYNLNRDLLSIPIPEDLRKNNKFSVTISYKMTLPELGWRLSKVEDSFYLAQWYPMLVTYKDGKWNYGEYGNYIAETFFTDFSDFEINYEIPDGYAIISSSDHERFLDSNSGNLIVENEKEVFLAITKDLKMVSSDINDTEIRVFYREINRPLAKFTLKLAKQAFKYFEESLGDYEDQQLDIIIDTGFSMEYPGVVTVNPNNLRMWYEDTVVHEIAHQWFYRKVSNDSYHESWLDEGITTLATTMFYYDGMNRGNYSFLTVSSRESDGVEKPSNLPVTKYQRSYFQYSQPALEMWELFENHGGIKEGKQFLKEYFQTFKNQHVTTNKFVEFTSDYFSIDQSYFESWLKIN